jgi:hypothetical protein
MLTGPKEEKEEEERTLRILLVKCCELGVDSARRKQTKLTYQISFNANVMLYINKTCQAESGTNIYNLQTFP